MRTRAAFALLLVVTALAAACPPKAAEAPVPPAGLAGAGPAPAAATGLVLPGSGAQVADPSGAPTPAGQLPAGHPPIGGNAAPTGAAPAPTGAAASLPPSLTGAPASAPPAPAAQDPLITGKIVEAMDVTEYTYMRVQTATGDEWVAISKTPVKVGDQVSVASNVVMENFPSRSLNRTFPRLTMGMLVGAPKKQ